MLLAASVSTGEKEEDVSIFDLLKNGGKTKNSHTAN